MKKIIFAFFIALLTTEVGAQEHEPDSICNRRVCKVCSWYREHKPFFVDGLECKYLYPNPDTVVAIIGYSASMGFAPDSVCRVPASVVHDGVRRPVRQIFPNALSGMLSVTSVIVEDGIEYIGDEAFRDCLNLRSVSIPASVMGVGQAAFRSCINLREIVVDSRNEELDSRDNCNAVIETHSKRLLATSPTTRIPSSVKEIGPGAFAGMETFEEIVLPDGVESIDVGAFEHCSNLKHITLPKALRRIDNGAFGGCQSLRSLRIPKGVTHIGSSCFTGCSSLTRMEVEKGNKVYDSREHCNGIIRTADSTLIGGCRTTVIVDGISTLDYAFMGVPVRTVRIPKSLTGMNTGEFEFCHEIDTVSVDPDNPVFSSPEGANAILSKDGRTLVLASRHADIPAGVEVIGECALSGTNRKVVLLPEGIREISYGAFCLNECVQRVVIPRSVGRMGENAFSKCAKLEAVDIQAPLKAVLHGTFQDCPQLFVVFLAEGTKKICRRAFRNCPKLRYVYVPASCEVEDGAFENCPLVEVK